MPTRSPLRGYRTALLFALPLVLAGCERIESMIIERMAGRNLQGDHTEWLDDGSLHVVLCGTGSPIADAQRAGPCTAILAGGHFLLIDVGPGAMREVGLLRLPRARLDGVLLTHFHSDHIGEVGEANVQSWIAGRTAPLPIYGPPGIREVVAGFQRAYALDMEYRVVHHGAQFMPPIAAMPVATTVPPPPPDGETVVLDDNGLRVVAFAVDHAPISPAYGYRVDYRGRSVVISGDTKPVANLVAHARDADVLITEALAAHMLAPVTEYARSHGLDRWAKLTTDVVNYHTTPVQAATEAREANVGLLVLTHIVPPLPNWIARRMFMRGVADAWDGEVILGSDGLHLAVPPDSKHIMVDELH